MLTRQRDTIATSGVLFHIQPRHFLYYLSYLHLLSYFPSIPFQPPSLVCSIAIRLPLPISLHFTLKQLRRSSGMSIQNSTLAPDISHL